MKNYFYIMAVLTAKEKHFKKAFAYFDESLVESPIIHCGYKAISNKGLNQ